MEITVLKLNGGMLPLEPKKKAGKEKKHAAASHFQPETSDSNMYTCSGQQYWTAGTYVYGSKRLWCLSVSALTHVPQQQRS